MDIMTREHLKCTVHMNVLTINRYHDVVCNLWRDVIKTNIPGSTGKSTGVVTTVVNAATQDGEDGGTTAITALHNITI